LVDFWKKNWVAKFFFSPKLTSGRFFRFFDFFCQARGFYYEEKKIQEKSFGDLIANGPINNPLQFWLLKKIVIVKPPSLTKKSRKIERKIDVNFEKKISTQHFFFKIHQIDKKIVFWCQMPQRITPKNFRPFEEKLTEKS